MFALPKLIVIIVVLVAAWVSYRWLNGVARELPRRRTASPQPTIHAEDLVPCGVCGAYIAAGAPGCGRPDCPQPR